MTKELEELLNTLWRALGKKGAASQKEIAQRMAEKGYRLTFARVSQLLRYVRDNGDYNGELQWGIAIAGRGPAKAGRYRRGLLKPDGTLDMVDDEPFAEAIEDGGLGTARYNATLNHHQAASWKMLAANTTNRREKEQYLGYAEDCEAMAKKSVRMANIIQLAFNGNGA